MDGGTEFGKIGKKTIFLKSYKRKGFVESHGGLCPEGTRPKKRRRNKS